MTREVVDNVWTFIDQASRLGVVDSEFEAGNPLGLE